MKLTVMLSLILKILQIILNCSYYEHIIHIIVHIVHIMNNTMTDLVLKVKSIFILLNTLHEFTCRSVQESTDYNTYWLGDVVLSLWGVVSLKTNTAEAVRAAAKVTLFIIP